MTKRENAVPETFSVNDSVELAVVQRSGFIESRHAGSAVVLAPDGAVIRTLGSANAPIFPRSTLKPFQAIAIMSSGVELRGEEAAIATASHTGTPAHVELARRLLTRAGLTEDALRCPAAFPSDSAARDALVRDHLGKSRIHMNCSGKHAAMLLACIRNDWPIESYLSPDHPLQKRILDVIERFTGERPTASGLDGCGAPVHAISLTALARGVQRVGTSLPSSPFAIFREAGHLADAVRAHGWVIDGPGRPDTIAIDRLGVFAKSGAEGVAVMTAPNGTTVALKVLDGSLRAASYIAMNILADAGALDRVQIESLAPELDLIVYGGDAPVGRINYTATA